MEKKRRTKQNIQSIRQKKEVKSLARHDKRQHFKNIAETAEQAAQKNNLRELYRISRLLSGNFKTIGDVPIKGKKWNNLDFTRRHQQPMG